MIPELRLHCILMAMLASALIIGGCTTPPPSPDPDPDPPATLNNAILFVTQTPTSSDFTVIVSTFGNHQGHVQSAPRGGDLYIRYDDGTLRNLTEEAGFGITPGEEIAVRDPHVHWEGEKALFSMVIGGTTRNDLSPVFFQIYEVTGILQSETVAIRRLNQPDNVNNIAPAYGIDDSILFTSDRPRSGDMRLYPQLDEYESSPTVSGLWQMNADGTNLRIIDHAPSGDFEPFVDSAGRIVFTRWDHLQRDQQADLDILNIIAGNALPNGATTFASEADDTPAPLDPADEMFPEQRIQYGENAPDPVWDHMEETETGHRFNLFFPWMLQHDGTGLETLNHIGRLELSRYIQNGRTYLPEAFGFSTPRVENLMHMEEDPNLPGYFYMTNAPEFGTHASGQIVALYGPPGENADDMRIEYLTHADTSNPVQEGGTPPATHSGLYRDPFATADGRIWAVHSGTFFSDAATTTDPGPPNPFPLSSRYQFAIRQLVQEDGTGPFVPGPRLNPTPISKSITYFDNFRFRTIVYDGPLWELQPVEVLARPRPTAGTEPLPAIEQNILAQELGGEAGVAALREYLVNNDLALVVSRDVTVRGDKQQDINLKIANSDHMTGEPNVTPKEIEWLQFFEGEQVRGYRRAGRRVLAREMDDALNPPEAGAPTGAVKLGADGSMAAFVPAGRALTWQTTEPDGTPAVRERYWLTFQPGEIRSCANCHGLNRTDVFGNGEPENDPQALVDLLQWWLAGQDGA